ncbi:MAG: SDR family NAD(P)-dependent oxidoreductase [Candidatus Omnitrophota bacterium]
MPADSHSKIILITGCSSGFGLLMASRLAAKGHRVIATMRDLNKSGALRDEVTRRGGEVDLFRLDVTDKASIDALVQQIGVKYGYVDVLINNAGYGIGGFFESLTEEEIRQQMETNFFGVQNVTRAVIPFMRPRKEGKIINVSSVAGLYSSPCFGAYNASKWALEGFSESLRHELKFFGIDVLLIEPGTYKTKIFHENARYAHHYDHPDSPYYTLGQFLKKRVMDYVNDCYKDPEEVAILAEKLINAKNPSFRNIPDIESQVLYVLRKFLPFRLYSWLYRKVLFASFNPGQNS